MKCKPYITPSTSIVHCAYLCDDPIPVVLSFGPGDVGGKDADFEDEEEGGLDEVFEDNNLLKPMQPFDGRIKFRDLWE